jgi:tetrapyrrole methylase family protein/MazG family protein
MFFHSSQFIVPIFHYSTILVFSINPWFLSSNGHSLGVPFGAKPLSSSVITHFKNTSSDDQKISGNFTLENGPKLPYVNGKRETGDYRKEHGRMKKGGEFQALAQVMDRLRGEDGCPWDKKQTFESLKTFLVEEVYEVLEAIDEGSPAGLKEELGDLLMHIFFIAQIAKERSEFDISDVARSAVTKMINRHPHVFGGTRASTPEEVEVNWSELKRREKGKSKDTSLLDNIPLHLPALLRAYRLTQRASSVGFDWKHVADLCEKIEEELRELGEVIRDGDQRRIEAEFGDLLFTLANIGRFIGANPEEALRKSNAKFVTRFQYMEKVLSKRKKSLKETSLREMDRIWEEAKALEPLNPHK